MLRAFGFGGSRSGPAGEGDASRARAAADRCHKSAPAAPAPDAGLPKKILLVIDAGSTKWAEVFAGRVVSLEAKAGPPRGQHKPVADSDVHDGRCAPTRADSGSGYNAGAGAGAGATNAVDPSTGTKTGGAEARAGAGGGTGAPGDASKTTPRTRFGIEVVQTSWDTMNLASYSSGGCYVNVATESIPSSGARFTRTRCVKPDFLLIRNECRGVAPGQDKRNLLYGLRYGLIPSVNTIQSVMMMSERPIVHAELLEIQHRVGRDAFPVVDQTYYPNHREMLISPDCPCVVKVGHAHAGYGKMVVQDPHQFEDFSSVMACIGSYCTAESFIPGAYDLRIQKIGNHYRAFKRESVSGTWKTNTGTSVAEATEVTPQYKLWADECSKCFGGLDIVTVDAIHSSVDDSEHILEMNGTSSGFMPDCADEDNGHVADVVVAKMEALVKA